MYGSCSRWDEALMPLVHGGNERRADPCQERSPEEPLSRRAKRGAPSTEQQKRKNAIANDVSGLAKIEVKNKEGREIDFAEQARQQGIKQTAGVLR